MQKSMNYQKLVGKPVRFVPIHRYAPMTKRDYVDGKIIWVHPKSRFLIAEYGAGLRECFPLPICQHLVKKIATTNSMGMKEAADSFKNCSAGGLKK